MRRRVLRRGGKNPLVAAFVWLALLLAGPACADRPRERRVERPMPVNNEDPRRPETIADVITLFQGFAAMSGGSNTSHSPDRADHLIFDPRTSHSPAHVASVTAPTGILADGLSTACMVLGRRPGEEPVARWPGCAAHIGGKRRRHPHDRRTTPGRQAKPETTGLISGRCAYPLAKHGTSL